MISARLTFAIYLLAAFAGALLYQTSYAVDEVRAKIGRTDRQIVAEQENIQVLGAEWTYLTEPSRIEQLASKYLHLEATKTQRVAALHDMNRVVAQVAERAETAPVAVIAAAAQPPLIAPKKDVVTEPVLVTAAIAPVPAAKPAVKMVAASNRASSGMLQPVAQKVQPRAQQASLQSTTPGSVKLLLASFQSQSR